MEDILPGLCNWFPGRSAAPHPPVRAPVRPVGRTGGPDRWAGPRGRDAGPGRGTGYTG